MKKIIGVIMFAVLLVSFTALSFAQETDQAKSPKMGKDMTMDKPMQCSMMRKCPMMGMMSKSMATTDDGTVVVLAGNKLLKYNKNLELVKEVEIKGTMDSMQMSGLCPKCQEMMKNKKNGCPMCGMVMKDAKTEKPVA